MTTPCPNCKHNLPAKDFAGKCPTCGWEIQPDHSETAKIPPEKIDATIDFPIRQKKDDAHKTTGDKNAPTIEFKPTAQTDDAEVIESNFLQTLPSVNKAESAKAKSAKQDPPFDPEATIITSATGDTSKTVRSVKTVIPHRTISRSAEPGELQDYILGKRIGSGSYGAVYQALQVPLDRSVAVKILTSGDSADEQHREKLQNEFLREAQFTGKLEHPNIVPVHDIGLTYDARRKTSRPFYVMKEIHGESWLQKIYSFSRQENLDVFKRVVDAIGYAHDKNVLHCDLKPENVMLGQFGEVLVVDWGQAIDLSRPESFRPGGTPAYISPEMARYWCDTHLDKLPDSPAKSAVGRRSDVYLLGAMLYEIVTRKMIRDLQEGESQFDLIRRACTNEVVDDNEFPHDELMQIARRALRLTAADHLESIEQLQEALRHYETRRSSIELRERADQLLDIAKAERSYDDFQRARFGYEESIQQWRGNEAAVDGLNDARLSCAEMALSDQNFDLGIDMLAEPKMESERQLKKLLIAGKTRRDRRKKLVRALATGLAASIIFGIGVNAYMINLNLQTAREKARLVKEIEPLRNEIEPLRKEFADTKKQIEQFPLKLKQEQDKFQQEKQTLEAEIAVERDKFDVQLVQQREAHEAKLELEKAKLDSELTSEREKLASELVLEKKLLAEKLTAEKSRFSEQLESEKEKFAGDKQRLSSEISSLNESSQLLRFKSSITSIRQELDNGNFREARKQLDAVDNKDNWDWARLNLLSHREVDALYPQQNLHAVNASADGRRLALVFADKVEVRDTLNFGGSLLVIPIANVQAVAISADGQMMALGIPAQAASGPGQIQIFDLTDSLKPQLLKTLDAQSEAIHRLEFSQEKETPRLLSVGRPAKLRKSSGEGLEEELMVWSGDWKRLDVKFADGQGGLPKFTSATFSKNGSRILTTYPDGTGREQALNLYSETQQTYQWVAQSPITNFSCATFLNDDGTEIIGCARDSQTGTFALTRWIPGEIPVTASSNRSSSFVSVEARQSRNQISTFAQLDARINWICRSSNWLATCGEDRRTSLWNLKTNSATRYGGHSQPLDFCSIMPGKTASDTVIVSVAMGSNSEILKTDLSTYHAETTLQRIAESATDDNPSPTSLFRSPLTGRSAFGNDQGQAAVSFGDKSIQWEVSAWKKHFLTDDFLFAQSRGDYFYKYDRRSGDLVSVLTKLAQTREDRRAEIIGFDVSRDGKLAVVVTDLKSPEFEVWNLETQQKLHTINYGQQQIFGTNTDKELLVFRISPDGKWIVAGKVGLFAWSTETGLPQPLDQSSGDLARTPISAIRFLEGTSKFVASWKGRIDLLDFVNQNPTQRFNIPNLSYNKNESNIEDAIVQQGKVLLLVRSTSGADRVSGITLLDLQAEKVLHSFAGAKLASFSRTESSEVIVVNESQNGNSIVRFNLQANMPKPIELKLQGEQNQRFQSLQNVQQFADGSFIIQATTRNPLSPVRVNWNTASFGNDLEPGQLQVLAKPKIDYCAVGGDVAVTLENGSCRFWRVSPDGVRPTRLFPKHVHYCKLSPDETRLAIVPVGSSDILIVDPKNLAIIETVRNGSNDNATTIDWSADARKIAVARKSGSIEIWAIGSNQNEQQLDSTIPVTENEVTELALSHDGSVVMSIFGNIGSARISRLTNGRWISFLIQHETGAKLVAGDLSANGNRAVTGSESGNLTMWNTEFLQDNIDGTEQMQSASAERELFEMKGSHQSPIRFVKFLENETGQTEIVSAESKSGNNSYVVWKSQPKKD